MSEVVSDYQREGRGLPWTLSSNMVARVSVAVPAISLTIAALWVGGWVMATFVALIGVLGAREIYDLARKRGVRPLDAVGMVVAAAIPFAAWWANSAGDWEPLLYGAALWWLVVLVVAVWARTPDGRPLEVVSVTIFGSLYASALPAFALLIRHGPHSLAHPRGSIALVVLPLVVTWIGDTCAMTVGTRIGGPQLAPVLSPRKTWAGAVAGVVGAVVTAVVYGTLVLARASVSLSVGQLVMTGIVLAIVGQVGDAAESLFKREAGVKDSSSLLPGHGGVLDRLDSLYFVLPVSAGLFRLFGVA